MRMGTTFFCAALIFGRAVHPHAHGDNISSACEPMNSSGSPPESKAMDTGMVTVNAEAITKGIDATGHIAIYGVYFDTNSAVIKPESSSTLEEIAKLLNGRSPLKLLVVGHTDSQGDFEHNMGLSQRRAEAVTKFLVNNYGIDEGRLRAAGVGYLSPVASNDTPEGRTKNRRVELVKR